jgi:hypothetical protein
MERARPAVLFVHGLPLWRSPLKGWVTYCRSAVIAAGAEPVSFAYSRWAGLAALLWPQGRAAARLSRDFLDAYARLRDARGTPAVIAHSLGSYLVARALIDHPAEVAFRGLVFFGSVVSPDYDWAIVIRRGQVPARYVRNEVGLHDWPLRWARLLGSAGYPYGPAGLEGFRRGSGRPSLDHPYAGAVGARGLARYCRDVWLPFLELQAPLSAGPALRPGRREPSRRRGPAPRAALVMTS